MTDFQKWSLFLLRVSLGMVFFYAGITKVINPQWSAAGYLRGAAQFSSFFSWLASDTMLPLVNFLNEWGLTLIGAALLLGIGVRLAGFAGAAMMVLYYLPLGFLHPNEHALIVDEHIVYAAGLLVLAAYNAGSFWTLRHGLMRSLSAFPRVTRWLR